MNKYFVLTIQFLVFFTMSDVLTGDSEFCNDAGQDCEKTFTAILLGGTGATGRELLNELNANGRISKIIFITRRPIQFPDKPKVRKKYLDYSVVNI